MSDPTTRRRLLAAGAGLAGLAGCLGGGDAATTEESSDAPMTATETTERAATTAVERTTAPADRVGTVRFEESTGETVVATRYGGGDCGVVLVPQVNLDRESWEPQASALADEGYLALAVDENPEARAASVLAAVEYLRAEAGVDRVVLVGASTGGEAVVVANAAAESGAVDGTVTLSAAGGADRAAELQGRLLFVVSEGDEDRFVRIARELHREAPDPKRLLTYEGSDHGQRLFTGAHGDELSSTVLSFGETVCTEE